MSNVHEMDLHYVWLQVWSGPADVPLQCLRQVACVTNSHLKHIFITGPESVGSAAFIFCPLTGWMGASAAPQMGRRVSHVAFGLFPAVTLHFLKPEFSSEEGACQPLTHGRIRDLTFFYGTVGLRMDASFDFVW